jgi:hypothetical protein
MRCWKRILLALLIVSLTFFYPLLAPTPHRIDQAHADLIVQGMTKEQVEAIFGVPAGQYDWAEENRDAFVYFQTAISYYALSIREDGAAEQIVMPVRPVKLHLHTSMTWTSRHGSFSVRFDQDERVASKSASPQVRIVPPWQRWWRVWKQP